MVSSIDTEQTCDCANEPIQEIERLFVKVLMLQERICVGQDPARRPAFVKPHGCAFGKFEIDPNLPPSLKVGVFKSKRFDAWVRFSSDALPPLGKDEKNYPLGLAIKLFKVPGQKILEEENEATTHDFIMQNYDIFFVDKAKDMCEFTCAWLQDHDFDQYIRDHPKTGDILSKMHQEVKSVLHIDYWSILPYKFGLEDSATNYVKYKVHPVSSSHNRSASDEHRKPPNYLHDDLRQQLLNGEASFTFCIQLRTKPNAMPLDEATVRWEEAVSPFIPVATLTLYQQDIDSPGQAMYGENLSYTPWHALPEHQPVGSLSEVRKAVYRTSAELRHQRNGIPYVEPVRPLNPLDPQWEKGC